MKKENSETENTFENKIKKRIEELEKDIASHQQLLKKNNQEMQKIQMAMISKNGAVIELQKIILPGSKSNKKINRRK